MSILGQRTKRVVVIGSLALTLASVFLVITLLVGLRTRETASPGVSTARERRPSPTRVGNARALQASYERWKAQYVMAEGDRRLVLPLGYSKGLSSQFTKAQGQVRLDLVNGTISVEVSGLPAKQAFDVWLVDNRPGPGRSVKPEAGDRMVRAGQLERVGDAHALREGLGQELLTGFELDLIVVAPAGGDPGADGLLFATPSLFHRLYYREQRTTVASAGSATSTVWTPFSVLVPSPAWAQASAAADPEALVNEGRRLFFEETFGGNGRTCGSCHPAQNNFTLDPAFIATLPDRDPLFVAEFNPKLRELENPRLMREFGLILENVDGFKNLDGTDRPGVMRGVPHTLALGTSLTRANDAQPPNQRTGWSGDGAPGTGTLREFATGAVVQHFPKTLKRVAGEDFRLPTGPELDAMEAFQLSLGRQTELDLASMLFRNPTVEQGKQLFRSEGARCNVCHDNAGANVTSFGVPGNRNFNTGVEDLIAPSERTDSRGRLIRPRDGGFGTTPEGTDPDGFKFFGNGNFNTPTLVEAADTPPFFHNNAVQTIEEAVAFYTSDAFSGSPSGTPNIVLTPDEVNAIAAFLRVINALENIRSAIATHEVARDENLTEARSSLESSIGEIDDAIRVLTQRNLHRDAVLRLALARGLAVGGRLAALPTLRNLLIGQSIAQLEAARALLVTQ